MFDTCSFIFKIYPSMSLSPLSPLSPFLPACLSVSLPSSPSLYIPSFPFSGSSFHNFSIAKIIYYTCACT